MRQSDSLSDEIAIMHHVPGLPGHSDHLHPHDWYINVRVEGDPIAAEGMSCISKETRDKFYQIVAEYKDRNVNDMMPSGIPSVHGFGRHLWDRLSFIKGLVRMDVAEDLSNDRSDSIILEP